MQITHNRLNALTRGLVLSGTTLATAWALGSDPNWGVRSEALAQGSMPVSLELSRFICHNADEDSFYSNGDEPYLFVAALYADGTTIRVADISGATVRLQSPSRTHGNLGRTGVDGGDSFAVPPGTGRFLTTIRPIDTGGLADGRRLARVGVVVIAMEEDATPDSAADAGRRALVEGLQRELNAAVRSLREPDVEALRSRLADKIREAVTEESLRSISGIFSLADPDDYIGAAWGMWSYQEIEDAGAAGLPISMGFRKSGVDYSLSGRVQREAMAPRPVTVRVHRARQIDNLDTDPIVTSNEADFYALVSIGGVERRSGTAGGHDDVRPDWRLSAPVSDGTVPITIRLFDEDGGLAGDDDSCDINSRAGRRELSLRYNLATGEITGDVTGRRGEVLHSRGAGDSSRAEVWFSIEG
jgi:hypothetical protein